MKRAVIVVDMLNPYDHEDADRLVDSAKAAIKPIAALVERAADQGVEIIYVNDNHGDWSSSQEELAEAALNGRRPDLVEPVLPPDDADFVLKLILYSALDAHVRHLEVTISTDGVAHIHEDLAQAALR